VVEQGNLEEVILQPELDFSAVDRPYTTRIAYVIGHGLQGEYELPYERGYNH